MGKRIGILTSGGDCAGLNATIRGATLRAAQEGWTTIGIRNGTEGLAHAPPQAEILDPARCDAQMATAASPFCAASPSSAASR